MRGDSIKSKDRELEWILFRNQLFYTSVLEARIIDTESNGYYGVFHGLESSHCERIFRKTIGNSAEPLCAFSRDAALSNKGTARRPSIILRSNCIRIRDTARHEIIVV